MSLALERELDYLAHLVMRETRNGKIPEALRDRIEHITEDILRRQPPSRYQMEAFEQLRYRLHGNEARVVYDALHRLRRGFHEIPYRESMFAQRRIAELEAEVETLRKQLEAEHPEESEDEQNNMVKKFNSSKNRVFVIMPFSPDFDDVWNGGIKRACLENDSAALRVDQVNLSSWITDDVEEYIKKSYVVIADVTGSNPNVMFELGYALAKSKDPIIIMQTQGSDKVPFDISGMRRIEYEDSWQGIEQLAKDLKKYLVMTFSKQKKRKTRKKTAAASAAANSKAS